MEAEGKMTGPVDRSHQIHNDICRNHVFDTVRSQHECLWIRKPESFSVDVKMDATTSSIDPRGRVITVTFVGYTPCLEQVNGG